MKRHNPDVLRLAGLCGFGIQMTGGGCDALRRECADGSFILITDAEDGSALPRHVKLPVMVGHYDKDGHEITVRTLPSLEDALGVKLED